MFDILLWCFLSFSDKKSAVKIVLFIQVASFCKGKITGLQSFRFAFCEKVVATGKTVRSYIQNLYYSLKAT